MNALSPTLDRPISSFFKPCEVVLHFRTINGALLAEARDKSTGETVMVEALPQMRGWLDALGFHYVMGSNGQWAK